MTVGKRLLDLTLASLLLVFAGPILAVLALVVLIRDGRPVFYASERMKSCNQPFTLWKLRTMRPAPDNAGVTGADKSDRITPTGRWLRRTRLDELPQIYNVLRGDISFVGPRPPLRLYVEADPELYSQVLKARPGLTGLATVVYHRHEAAVLAGCATPQLTHEAYLRRCVPTKARLDLIYLRHQSMCVDLWLIWLTLRSLMTRH